MMVFDGQEPLGFPIQPLQALSRLAARTVTIATGVVINIDVLTTGTTPDMTTQSRRATLGQITQGPALVLGQPTAILIQKFSPVVAD
jgi:hypothetical protein